MWLKRTSTVWQQSLRGKDREYLRLLGLRVRRVRLMWDLLKRVLGSGVKTSEFFVVILAIMAPLILGVLDQVLKLSEPITGGPETFVGGLVAAVYVFVRGWIKAAAAKAAVTDSGNRVGAGLGSAAAEAEYARASTPLSGR